MGKRYADPENQLTEAECRRQVNLEIPWVVGQGSSVLKRRRHRLVQLLKYHGHPTAGVNPRAGIQMFHAWE